MNEKDSQTTTMQFDRVLLWLRKSIWKEVINEVLLTLKLVGVKLDRYQSIDSQQRVEHPLLKRLLGGLFGGLAGGLFGGLAGGLIGGWLGKYLLAIVAYVISRMLLMLLIAMIGGSFLGLSHIPQKG